MSKPILVGSLMSPRWMILRQVLAMLAPLTETTPKLIRHQALEVMVSLRKLLVARGYVIPLHQALILDDQAPRSTPSSKRRKIYLTILITEIIGQKIVVHRKHFVKNRNRKAISLARTRQWHRSAIASLRPLLI